MSKGVVSHAAILDHPAAELLDRLQVEVHGLHAMPATTALAQSLNGLTRKSSCLALSQRQQGMAAEKIRHGMGGYAEGVSYFRFRVFALVLNQRRQRCAIFSLGS